MIDKLIDSRRLLVRIDSALLIKMLQENLASISLLLSKIVKKLDEKVIFLLKAIDIAIDAFIPKTKLQARSILEFDQDCKDAQMKTKKLKKI